MRATSGEACDGASVPCVLLGISCGALRRQPLLAFRITVANMRIGIVRIIMYLLSTVFFRARRTLPAALDSTSPSKGKSQLDRRVPTPNAVLKARNPTVTCAHLAQSRFRY